MYRKPLWFRERLKIASLNDRSGTYDSSLNAVMRTLKKVTSLNI